jgi:hypothetical protein
MEKADFHSFLGYFSDFALNCLILAGFLVIWGLLDGL